MEYIWYCTCGAVILKTQKPFISDLDGKTKCAKCQEVVLLQDIFDKNLHNMKKYLKLK